MPFDGELRSDKLAKIDRVIGLLADREKWCKQQLRRGDGARCILGAMMAADAISLKDPILLAIHQVTGRAYLRIEMFNDHPLTTHSSVVAVLRHARDNILHDRAAILARPVVTRRETFLHRTFRRIWR